MVDGIEEFLLKKIAPVELLLCSNKFKICLAEQPGGRFTNSSHKKCQAKEGFCPYCKENNSTL